MNTWLEKAEHVFQEDNVDSVKAIARIATNTPCDTTVT